MESFRKHRRPTSVSYETNDVTNLRRTIRDLMALPAMPSDWVSCDLERSLENVTDVLRAALRAFRVCLRVQRPDGSVFETEAASGLGNGERRTFEVTDLLNRLPSGSAEMVEIPTFDGGGPMNVLPHPICVEGSLAGCVAACYKPEVVPGEDDHLILHVACDRIALLLQRDKNQEHRRARELAEQRLLQAQYQYEQLVQTLPAAVYTCDALGRITCYNRRAAALWGRKPHLNDDREKFCAAYRARLGEQVLNPEETPMAVAVREGKPFRDVEAEFERPEGSKISVLVNIDPLFDAEGRPAGAINVFQDITALKRVQSELRSRQDRLHAMVENTPECVKLVARDGTVLEINATGLSILGASSPDEIIGKCIYEMVASDHREAFRAMNERVCAGAREKLEFEVVSLRGTRHHVETRAVPMMDARTGQTVQLALTRDITERKRAEAELRRRVDDFQTLIETAPVGNGVATDAEGRHIWGNLAFSALLYCAPDQNISKTGPDAAQLPFRVFKDGREVAAETLPMQRACRQAEATEREELEIVRADGSRLTLLCAARPLFDEAGGVRGCIGAFLDITPLKNVESQLREKTQQLSAFLETAAVGLHRVGPDGRILWANAAELEMLGYSAEEYVGHHIAEFHIDVGVIEDILERLTRGEKLHGCEARMKCRDGSIKHVLIDSSALWHKGRFVHTQCFTRDITEKKRAEEELRRSQERLTIHSKVLESMAEGAVLTAEDGTILYTNPACDAMFGYAAGEQTGKHATIHNDLPPEENRHFVESIIADLKEKGFWEGEFRNVRKDGSRFISHGRISPLELNGKKHWVCVQQDVTARRQAEEALRRSEERLRAVFDSTAVGVAVLTPEARFVQVNDAFCSITGYMREEFCSMDCAAITHPEDMGRTESLIRDVAEGRRATFAIEKRFVCKSGAAIWVLNSVSLTRDARGNVEHLVALCQDITKRKAAEEELRESQRKLATLMANLPGMVYRCPTEPPWHLTFVSEGVQELTGWSAEDFIQGRVTWMQMMHSEDVEAIAQEVEKAVREHRVFSLAYRIVHRSGHFRWVLDRGQPVYDKEGLPVAFEGFVGDLTEQKRAEEALRNSELRFRSLVNSVEGIVWECAIEEEGFRFTFVSDQAERLTGYPVRQWLEEPEFWPNHIHPEDRYRAVDYCRSSTSQKRDHQFEYRMIAADGRVVWLRDLVTVVVKDDKPVRLVGVMVDITGQKTADAALRYQLELTKTITDNTRSCLFMMDVEGRTTFVNPAVEVVTGYKPEELLGQVLHDKIHHHRPDGTSYPRAECPLDNALPLQKVLGRHEDVFVRKDGSFFPVRCCARPIFKEGVPVGTVIEVQDITREKLAEEALQRSEAQFRQLADSMPQIVWTARVDGYIDYYNRRWSEYTGFADDFGDESWKAILHPEDAQRTLETYYDSIRREAPYQIEYRFKDQQSGGYRWFLGRALPIRDASGTVIRWFGTCTDIDDQKRAEQRLAIQYFITRILAESASLQEASARILQAVCANADWDCGGVWTVDPEKQHLRCIELWQHPELCAEELIAVSRACPFSRGIGLPGRVWASGQAAWISSFAEDDDFPRAPYAAKAQLRSAVGFPIRVQDDVLGVMEFFSRDRREPDEEFLRMLSAAGNQIGQFVERKWAERDVHRMAAIIESSDDAVIGEDLAGNITSWNHGAQRLYGYTEEETLGKPIALIIPPERQEEHRQILQRIHRGEHTSHFETVRRRRDGTPVHVSIAVSPIKDTDGRIIGASKIARDISERKCVEEQQQALYQLVASANRAETLQEVYEAALQAICRCHGADRASILVCDNQGTMRFKAWRDLSEEYRRAVEGHSPWKSDERDPQPVCIEDVGRVALDEHLRDVIEREGIGALVFIPIAYDNRLLGKFMMYFDAPRRLPPERIQPAQTIASQIAFALERHRSREALERLVEERTASLREAIAQMEEFSYSVSHDLRSPLRAMHAYAQALMEDYRDELDATARNYLERIHRSSLRMDKLTQDVLTYSRVARTEVQLECVDLNRLVADLLDQYSELQISEADFVVEGTLHKVLGHESSLGQCLSNLLSNAAKFVRPGTAPKVRIWSESRGADVRLWVEDNGIGIEPEHQQRIFQMFERLHPDASSEGTGIGLAVVRRAMEKMGGKVGVESDGTNGSRFWLQLPWA